MLSTKGLKGSALNFVLGGLAVLGHAPFYLWPVTIICLALLMLRLDRARELARPVRAGFWQGFTFALGYFLFGFYWIGSAFIARGPEFVPFMPFAVLGLCAGLALIWAPASALYIRLTLSAGQHALRAPLFAGLLFLAEYVRGHLFGGFPWNLPGYIFAAGKPVSQIASMVGIYGLSALVLFLAATLALALDRQGRRLLPFGIGLVVLGGSFVYGSARLKNADVKYVDGVNLRIVHANIAQKDKMDPDKYIETVNHYLRLTMGEGFENITHVIWPEGAVPGLMFENENLMQTLDELFRSGSGTPPILIAQGLRAQPVPGRDKPAYYNAAAAITFQDGAPPQISSYYDKQKLVPFGEFIPGGALAEKLGLTSLSSALASMTPGRSGNTPDLPNLPPASIQICYEIIFPGFTPKTLPPSGKRPQWILNLSNDSWYGNSTGPRQHVNQVRYRAIEQGLPVIRATSGGISGSIDPYGRQLAQRGLGEDGILDTPLPRYIQKNAYNRGVNHKILLLIVVMLLGCWVGIRRAH